MIGQELGGRYEILSRIGGGGMALVYKAHDILLGRKVAVKVLRQQYVHDEEFIRRFRREAQSAAALSHPNVVSIYDVGQDGDVHYIVMECVEGYNLNELIKERAPLQVDEAVHIACQICDALDHAHQNQIIHRDIKPHNILIGKNGRVKVTDFGIARAATSSTITQTGSVVGSVHYFSPEHAKGVMTGEKSDIYSLGIVLYQMLTGRLPFLGESPISVALKHLQEHFEEPRKVNPLIPQSVENVIIKSMRKNPAERYQSAKEMLHDLETCLSPQRRNEPKLTYTSANFGGMDDEEPTRVIPAIKPDQIPTVSMPSSGAKEDKPDLWRHEDTEEAKTARGWVKPTIWVSVTIVLLALMWFGVMYVKSILYVPDVDVPNVVNMKLDDAKKKLEEVGLSLEEPVTYEFKEDVEKDIVFAQNKTGKVKEGSSVKLSVSKGIETITMRNYVGKMYQDVVDDLRMQGVDKIQIKSIEDYSDSEPGTVIKQTPDADTEIDPKKVEFEFTISKGREPVDVPDLIGLTVNEAKIKLNASNLKMNPDIKQEPSYAIPSGKIFKQEPNEPNASVAPGTEITVYVSTGYPEDALEYTYNIAVSPAEIGKTSKVRIVYSDARGDNIEWGTRKIKDMVAFPVGLVLSPTKDAVVQVYRDDQLVDAKTITYTEAQGGSGPDQEPVDEPVQDPPADPQSTDTTTNNDNSNIPAE